MFEQSISRETRLVLEKIARSGLTHGFYLGGGTTLALELGHRQSIDLDWFARGDFSNGALKEKLAGLGKLAIIGEEDGTLNAVLDGVKLTFLCYRYPLLFPTVEFESVRLADERDIAAMKIDAASSRGSRKDFVDLYFLLKKYMLAELIDIFERKYEGIEYNKLHILKSLVYFEDAGNEPILIIPSGTRMSAYEMELKRSRRYKLKSFMFFKRIWGSFIETRSRLPEVFQR
jgi:hypothetical protein